MTSLAGLVVNVWQLAATRFLMGAGEACCAAPSNSLLSDVFREARRPLALSIFGSAYSIAFIAFFPAVGWIGERHGWRSMFVAGGLPGLVLALIFFLTVKEPVRGASEGTRRAARPQSFGATLRFLASSRVYLLILLGVMFMGANIYAAGTWNSAFLMRVHNLGLADIASSIGPIRGLVGGVGVILGGLLTDRLGRRDERWRLRLPAIACLLAAPAEAVFLLGDSRLVWMAGLASASLLTLIHQGPVYAVAMSVARARMRAVPYRSLSYRQDCLGS